MKLCGACGCHARHAKSPELGLRARDCPRFEFVHRACCEREPCSERDAAGHVRCGWEKGGRERVLVALLEQAAASVSE